MSIKDKETGEIIEVRKMSFTMAKTRRDLIRGIMDNYKSMRLREGVELNDNAILEEWAVLIHQAYQDNFNPIKEI